MRIGQFGVDDESEVGVEIDLFTVQFDGFALTYELTAHQRIYWAVQFLVDVLDEEDVTLAQTRLQRLLETFHTQTEDVQTISIVAFNPFQTLKLGVNQQRPSYIHKSKVQRNDEIKVNQGTTIYYFLN